MNATNPLVTLEQVRDDWNACYRSDRLAKLYAEPTPLRDVMTRTDGPWADVPSADRIWTACNAMPERLRRIFALVVARRAYESVPAEQRDERTARCLQTIADHLNGQVDNETLAAAWAAAWDAARATARAAAWDAAEAAARDAARAAAWAAAWDAAEAAARAAAWAAARAAAWDAAWDAAEAAARDAQVSDIIALIDGTHPALAEFAEGACQ